MQWSRRSISWTSFSSPWVRARDSNRDVDLAGRPIVPAHTGRGYRVPRRAEEKVVIQYPTRAGRFKRLLGGAGEWSVERLPHGSQDLLQRPRLLDERHRGREFLVTRDLDRTVAARHQETPRSDLPHDA